MGKIPRGRSRERWLDVVEENLESVGIQEWRELLQDLD